MPTIRAKKVFKKVLNGSSISKAMLESGYAATTASTTGKLTNTKGWQELVTQFLPDDLLLKTHLEGLHANKWVFPHDAPNFETEDHTTRAKFLDMAYKAKGNYAPERNNNTINIDELRITIQQNLATFRTNKPGERLLPQPPETV